MKTAKEILEEVMPETRKVLREQYSEIEWDIIDKGIIKSMEEYAKQESDYRIDQTARYLQHLKDGSPY